MASRKNPAGKARKPSRSEAGGGEPQGEKLPPVDIWLPTQVRAAPERQIFGATGEGIVWAVLDSGIDSRHPHFQRHQNLRLDPPLVHRDFTASEVDAEFGEDALVDPFGNGTHIAGVIAGELESAQGFSLRTELEVLDERGTPSLQTAELPAISGLAPRCKLVSLKVLDDHGRGRASHVIEALRWVREVNGDGRKLRIHGVNLGLWFTWDPRWYACGQSPLCVEINELVKSGVVVVAAAGNTGFGPAPGTPSTGRAVMSIADPGNAEHAVTVGSANGRDPHSYGVSYFSSIGPTWDGRLKPDLLAPGERVVSCASGVSPSNRRGAGTVRIARYRENTGTSMSSAYVSGVIAALLSIRSELIGQPLKVKQLLLATAEDLHRDRYMQGHGLVNMMRALTEAGSVGRLIVSGPAAVADRPDPLREGTRIPAAPTGSPPGSPATESGERSDSGKRFAVALSYPAEHRDYVKKVHAELRRTLPRDKIFYDRFFEHELAGPNLSSRLQRIYHDESDLIVIFISAEYERKEWCGLEWRAIQDMIKRRQDDDVMPLRFDDTEVPGLFSIDGYVDLRDRDPEHVADVILERLEWITRKRR